MKSTPNASSLPKRRWYAPTPARFLSLVLLMQGVLFLSSRFHWFWFNDHKGYTALITVAATIVVLLLILVCLLVGWLFKAKWQFGVSTLLSSVLVTAIPLGWLGREIDLAHQQRAVVATLRKRGDYVSYEEGVTALAYAGFRLVPMTKAVVQPALHEFLERILGEDFFNDARFVSANGADDETLENIQSLQQLRAIQILNATVTDEGMKNLRGLSQLKSLQFHCATYSKPIGDKAMEHVSGLRQLEELHLGRADVTDAGLAQLRGLKRLTGLIIEGRGITNQGLAHLAELRELKSLSVTGPGITDEGLSHLAKLVELTSLTIHGDGIAGAGLESIKNLPRLKSLHLADTSITDAAVETLNGFQKLTLLNLYETKVSVQGVKQLREALPRCSVFAKW